MASFDQVLGDPTQLILNKLNAGVGSGQIQPLQGQPSVDPVVQLLNANRENADLGVNPDQNNLPQQQFQIPSIRPDIPGDLSPNNLSTAPTNSPEFLKSLIESTQAQQLASETSLNKTLSNKESGQALALLPLIFAADKTRKNRQKTINDFRKELDKKNKGIVTAKREQKFLDSREELAKQLKSRLNGGKNKGLFEYLTGQLRIDPAPLLRDVFDGKKNIQDVANLITSELKGEKLAGFREFQQVISPEKKGSSKFTNDVISQAARLSKPDPFGETNSISFNDAIPSSTLDIARIYIATGRGDEVPENVKKQLDAIDNPTEQFNVKNISGKETPETPQSPTTSLDDLNKQNQIIDDADATLNARALELKKKEENPLTPLSVGDKLEQFSIFSGKLVPTSKIKKDFNRLSAFFGSIFSGRLTPEKQRVLNGIKERNNLDEERGLLRDFRDFVDNLRGTPGFEAERKKRGRALFKSGIIGKSGIQEVPFRLELLDQLIEDRDKGQTQQPDPTVEVNNTLGTGITDSTQREFIDPVTGRKLRKEGDSFVEVP